MKFILNKLKKINQNSNNLLFVLVVIVLAVVMVLGIIAYRQHLMYKKDLSNVINISFSWNEKDIIAFEKEKYNNTDYITETGYEDKTILSFDPSVVDGENKYKHIYIFDKETQELKTIRYKDVGYDKPKCEHISEFVATIENEFGKWDKHTHDGLFKYLYGNLNGVKCEIKYQDDEEYQIIHFNAVR